MRPLVLLALVLLAPLAQAHLGLPAAPLAVDAPATPPPAAHAATRVLPTELPHPVFPRASTLGAAAAEAGSPDYSIAFQCPDATLGLTPPSCPFRVVDTDDLLGNPGLVVDPLVPGRLAFAALHGGVGGGPSEVSREGQTHTTYTTVAYGLNWEDQPYSPPSPPFDFDETIYGEDVHALIDNVSRTLHVASLYAWKDEGWRHGVVTWKFSQETRSLDYNFVNGYFESRVAGGHMGPIWLVEMEQAGLVALLWAESAPENETVTINGVETRAWLAGALSLPDPITEWVRFEETLLVPDCATPTNPVAHDARLYVGCTVETARDGAAPGELVMHELDTATFSQRPVGRAPFSGPDALLDVDTRTGARGEEDRLVLARTYLGPAEPVANETNATSNASSPTNETMDNASADAPVFGEPKPSLRPYVEFATARLTDDPDAPIAWEEPKRVGPLGEAIQSLVATRLNALLYRGETDTIHAIVREENDLPDDLDPEMRVPLWGKSLVVLDPLGEALVALDLDLSEKGEVFFDESDIPSDERVYGDTRDSLIEVADRIYVAFNDYSVIVVSEIVESDRRVQPIVLQTAPPVPQPAPAPQVSAAATTTGVFVGVGAGALVARLAYARFASASGAGRGKR